MVMEDWVKMEPRVDSGVSAMEDLGTPCHLDQVGVVPVEVKVCLDSKVSALEDHL